MREEIDERSISRSVLWSALESGGLSLLAFLSLIVYARFLSPEDFGLLATAVAFVELFTIISSMAFHDALVQKKDAQDLHFDTAFTVTIVVSLILCFITWLVSDLFGAAVGDPRGGAILSWLGLSFLFSGASATLVARQRREFGFRSLAIRTLLGRLGGLAVGLVAAVAGAGVWSLVLQQLCMLGFGTVILWLRTSAYMRPSFRFARVQLIELISFGGYSVAGLFTNFSIKRTFVFFVGVFLGAHQAGLLNLAFRMVDTLWALTATAISQVALPTMSKLQEDRARLLRAYTRGVGIACCILYPIFLGLGAVSSEVVQLLFGTQWIASAPYVSSLATMIILQAPRIFAAPMLAALGAPGSVLTAYLFGLIYMVVAIGATKLGSINVALVIWVLLEVMYLPVFGYLLKRSTGLTIIQQYRPICEPLLAAVSMVLAIKTLRFYLSGSLSDQVLIALFIPIGALVYTAVLYFIGNALLVQCIGFVANGIRKGPK